MLSVSYSCVCSQCEVWVLHRCVIFPETLYVVEETARSLEPEGLGGLWLLLGP